MPPLYFESGRSACFPCVLSLTGRDCVCISMGKHTLSADRHRKWCCQHPHTCAPYYTTLRIALCTLVERVTHTLSPPPHTQSLATCSNAACNSSCRGMLMPPRTRYLLSAYQLTVLSRQHRGVTSRSHRRFSGPELSCVGAVKHYSMHQEKFE